MLQGDNETAVDWVRRCRGGKEPRSGALMRLMGAIELAGGWHFDSLHVPGVLNDVADGISRWNPGDICRNLAALRPSIEWQELDLGVEGRELCKSLLATNSSAKPLRERLNALTKVISGVGSCFASVWVLQFFPWLGQVGIPTSIHCWRTLRTLGVLTD